MNELDTTTSKITNAKSLLDESATRPRRLRWAVAMARSSCGDQPGRNDEHIPDARERSSTDNEPPASLRPAPQPPSANPTGDSLKFHLHQASNGHAAEAGMWWRRRHQTETDGSPLHPWTSTGPTVDKPGLRVCCVRLIVC